MNDIDIGLEARNIHFNHGERVILKGIDLDLRPGEIVSLLGANGAGKTTLLRLLLGFDRPSAGEILLNGEKMSRIPRPQIAKHLAYVPQSHMAPFPYKVRDVVAMGRLPVTGLFRPIDAQDTGIVNATLARLTITHLAERPYSRLSGGERQLVLIARAIAQGARLLVMDEPVTGLDYGNQIRLQELLQRLAGDGYGVLLTTHYPEHAMAVSTRAALLHDGRIHRNGPPEEVITTQTIAQLYGVAVEAFALPTGHTAFIPADRSLHRKTAPFPGQ